MSVQEKPIANLAGLNLKDAADKVADNEFTQLQNVWQPSRGAYANRFGSVSDQPVSAFPLASRISGVWRHHAANGVNSNLYLCAPNATLLPDNTTDLTLSDVTASDGDIFGGGSVVALYVCYSWIGRGMEQTYNSKNRTGFPSVGSFPMDAHSNGGHQTITLAASGHYLKVTIPAFPSGITGANIFVARGTATQMTYMGTITTSGGNLTVKTFIGPAGARTDAFTGFLSDGVATSSATSGSLSTSTTYDFVVTVLDGATGAESYVSTIFNGTTSGSQTSLDVKLPDLPDGASFGSTINLYAGTHSGTKFIAFGSQTPGSTVNIKSIPGSGATSPSATSRQLVYVVPTNFVGSGQLPPGIYYIAAAWVINPSVQEGSNNYNHVLLSDVQTVTVAQGQNNIAVGAPGAASINGARAAYIFVGTQPPSVAPLSCVGILNANGNDFLDITSIPAHNAQSMPFGLGPDLYGGLFLNQVMDGQIGGLNYSIGMRMQARFGFLIGNSSGTPYEIFPSRSLTRLMIAYETSTVYAGDYVQQGAFPGGNRPDLHNFVPSPRTANDLYNAIANPSANWVQPYPWGPNVQDPVFAYQLGITYFTTGIDLLWMTDGHVLGQITAVAIDSTGLNQTLLPPPSKFVSVFQNGLIVAGGLADNQVYGSNGNAPQNWATGGAGNAMRYVSIGDAVGGGVQSFGLFSPSSDSPGVGDNANNPGSFMLAFKKTGTWLTNQIPDPTQSSLIGILTGQQVPTTMQQVSGRTGCTAYRSVAQTSIGTIFLGQDANVYLVNAVREPQRIGTKVQNLLTHLVGNDALMKMVTAVYHDRHYKMSYPSPASAKLGTPVNDYELWADLRTDDGPILWNGPHIGRNIGPQVVLAGDNDDDSRLYADAAVVRTVTADSISTLTDLDSSGNPQPIVLQLASKIYRGGIAAHAKRYFGLFMDAYVDYGYNNRVLLEGFADDFYQSVNRLISEGGAVWDSSQWDQTTYGDQLWDGFDLNFAQNLVGRTFQWRLTKSDIAPFVLASMTIMNKTEKRRIIR